MSTVTERLDGMLDMQYEHDQETSSEGWSIRTKDDAAWASRKAAKAATEITEISNWEAREIEKVRRAAETERARHQKTLEFFEGHLATFLLQEIREGRKTKSLELPGGRIQLRARQPKLEILDEEKALEQLRGTDHVQVKESVKKSTLKKALERTEDGKLVFKDTGEVIDWASFEEQPDSITFTPADEPEGEEEPS